MKLNHQVTNHKPGRIVQEFGHAKLFKHANGRHELIGGSAADIANANDWVSFFAHDVVFNQPAGTIVARQEPKTKRLVFRFHMRQPALA